MTTTIGAIEYWIYRLKDIHDSLQKTGKCQCYDAEIVNLELVITRMSIKKNELIRVLENSKYRTN